MDARVHTLVVDDEEGVRFYLAETLRQEGHQVVAAESGEEALDSLRETSYDLVILDLRLGGRADGMRVLEAIRWRWPETVVIILTAYGTLDSAMAAIREGIDGYLCKPAPPETVRKEIRDALRRRRKLVDAARGQEANKIIEAGPFRIDVGKHIAAVGDTPLDLTPQEWILLLHLIENRDRVLGPEELVSVVRDYEPEDLYEARQIIKWYVHRLRKKVEPDPSNPRYIVNIRGVGYTFGS